MILACNELFDISARCVDNHATRRIRNLNIQKNKIKTCKWLFTWYIVRPSFFISFRTSLGVAPVSQKTNCWSRNHLIGTPRKNEKWKRWCNLLSLPPSWLTASTKHPCSSWVHRMRDFTAVALVEDDGLGAWHSSAECERADLFICGWGTEKLEDARPACCTTYRTSKYPLNQVQKYEDKTIYYTLFLKNKIDKKTKGSLLIPAKSCGSHCNARWW